jgi:hypothetical protein
VTAQCSLKSRVPKKSNRGTSGSKFFGAIASSESHADTKILALTGFIRDATHPKSFALSFTAALCPLPLALFVAIC